MTGISSMTGGPAYATRARRGEADDPPRCPVCSHALADHDPIALRYCRAPEAQSLPRACICPSQ